MIKTKPSDWLKFADEDLRLAKEVTSKADEFASSICFHAQQCVEKCLKAFIVKYEGRVKKIHPDALPGTLPEGLPTKEDAQEALKFAKEIFQFTKERIMG